MEKRRRGRSRVLSISSNPLRSDRLFLAPSLTQELGPETRRPRRRFSRLEADENAPPSALNVSLEGSEEVLHESDTCFSFSTPIDTPTTRYHSTPERILDAPGLVDDFYTNCLHWSRPLDSVVVALGGAVYLWNSAKGSISQLCDLADERVTSVRCQPEYAPTSSGMLPPLRTRSLSTHAVSEKPLLDSAKTHVAVGTSRGALRLFDAASCRIARDLSSNTEAAVLSLDWRHGHVLAAGLADGTIRLHDVRARRHLAASIPFHSAPNGTSGGNAAVCTVAFSPHSSSLASGGNDGKVAIWDTRRLVAPRHVQQHEACVKAVAWCPWQRHLLGTGAGAADRGVRLIDCATDTLLRHVDAQAQVTALVWNPRDRALLTTHGAPSNHLTLWRAPSLQRVARLRSHESRVLHAALSPDGEVVVTAGADESLRFWRVFEPLSPAPTTPVVPPVPSLSATRRHSRGRSHGHMRRKSVSCSMAMR